MKIPKRKLFFVLIAMVFFGCSGDELDLNIKPFTANTYGQMDNCGKKGMADNICIFEYCEV